MNPAQNTTIPTTNPATGVHIDPVFANKEGVHLKDANVLQDHIQPGTLNQHATALQGHDIPVSSAFLVQGAPIGNAGFPTTGTLPNTGLPHTGAPLTGIPHTTGVPMTGAPNMGMGMPTTGIPHNQGVPMTGAPNMGMGMPTTGIPHNQGAVPVGFTSGGKPVGVTGHEQPSTSGTGLAGVSQATVQGIPQGNINKSAIGNTEGYIQTNVLPGHTVPGNTTAQGQFTFRPLEGRFTKDKDLIGKMDCYVKVKLGWHTAKTGVAQSQGTTPIWTDAITLARKHNETFAKLTVKDKDRVSKNDRLGAVKINLDVVVQKGRVQNWYPIATRTGEPRGEILVDVEYVPLFIH